MRNACAAGPTDLLCEVARLSDLVYNVNACELPGVDIKYNSFMDVMWSAVRAGYVAAPHARFVADGLRYGFTFGVDLDALRGQRIFNNYESTVVARDAITRALNKRVAAGKTICLGGWSEQLRVSLRERFENFFIFPMGAVEKPLEPGEYRPTSDHSRTGLNAATSLEFLRHSLTAYKDVAAYLQRGHFMYVSDVEAAFPMLPIHPRLWPFFMCRGYASPVDSHMSLYMHVTGDFGAAGLPGAFKIFLVDVVVQMARFVGALTLPMPVYVDDMALIAPDAHWANDEMAGFQDWAARVCGVTFKRLKDRMAAQRQLYLGLWWDSETLTRTLEESKLVEYLALLDEFAHASSLTLRQRRVVAGKMQRAVLTLPPGASCLLASIFALMAGLLLPWQKRRTTKEERSDYALLAELLRLNMGRGFYRHDDFIAGRATAFSDASKAPGYAGGGYVTRGVRNCYHYFKYGSRAARKPIMVLEGDSALKCGSDMGYLWRGLVVEFGVDNTSFMGSISKGYSRSSDLVTICKRWFILQVRHCFLVNWFWVSSEDNLLADHLSRNREEDFLADVRRTKFWSAEATEDPYVYKHAEAGSTRTFESPEGLCLDAKDISAWVPETEGAFGPPPRPIAASCDDGCFAAIPPRENMSVVSPRKVVQQACMAASKDSLAATACAAESIGSSPGGASFGTRGRPRGAKSWLLVACMSLLCAPAATMPASGSTSGVSTQQLSVPYARSMIFDGLPPEWVSRMEDIMDMRLTPSSMRTVECAMGHWRDVMQKYGWPVIISTDEKQRAARLATFVLHLMDDTSLAYKSISAYLWGVRQYMILHHQADPVFGIPNWREFMSSIQVLTHVLGEPRKALPMEVIQRVLEDTDETSFQDVCFAFFLVVLFFTFSRTECPCPKTFTTFDPAEHWQVCDLRWRNVDGVWCLAVRLKKIKQDPRVLRPAASGEGDWSYIGDSPEPFSILKWFKAYMSFFADARPPEDPFFLSKDRQRPYTYACASADLRDRLVRLGLPADLATLHGVRVEAYNRSLDANGEKKTVLHGRWAGPKSAEQYFRLDVASDIVPMAACTVRRWRRAHEGRAYEGGSDEDSDDREGFEPQSAGSSMVAERALNPRKGVNPPSDRSRASSRNPGVTPHRRRSANRVIEASDPLHQAPPPMVVRGGLVRSSPLEEPDAAWADVSPIAPPDESSPVGMQTRHREHRRPAQP